MKEIRDLLTFYKELGAEYLVLPKEKEREIKEEEKLKCSILFVSTAPVKEAGILQTFNLQARQMLDNIIKKLPCPKEEVFFASLLKEPLKKIRPSKEEILSNRESLCARIDELNPEVVLFMGVDPFYAVTGQEGSLMSLRSKVYFYKSIKLVLSFSFDYILNCKSKEAMTKAKWAVWDDIKIAIKLLEENN